MFQRLFSIITILAIAGCASNPFNSKNSPNNVSEQVLKTDITEENVQVETSCRWYTLNKKDCRITKVTAVGTAPSNGGTTMNRSVALMRACDYARANVSQMFNSNVITNRVNRTVAESIEKTGSTAVEEGEGNKQSNNKTNTNDTKLVTTYVVQVQSSKNLEGYRVIKQQVVGDQEVSCTIQYDEEYTRNLTTLH